MRASIGGILVQLLPFTLFAQEYKMKTIVDFTEPHAVPWTIVNDGVAYQAGFETRPGEWVEIDLPFERFQPTYRGRIPRGAEPLDPARIRQMSFFIVDKMKGPFNLEIAWVRSLTESAAVQGSQQDCHTPSADSP